MAKGWRVKQHKEKLKAAKTLKKSGFQKSQIKKLTQAELAQKAKEQEQIQKVRLAEERRKRRIAENKKGYYSHNISDDIISLFGLSDKPYTSYSKSRLKDFGTYSKKYTAIRDMGYSGEVIKGDLRLSWKKLNDKYGGKDFVYPGKKWLYVGVGDTTGEYDPSGTGWGVLSLESHIQYRLEVCAGNIDESYTTFRAVFKIVYGKESQVKYSAQQAANPRRYLNSGDFLSLEPYQRLVLKNTFSKRGFLDMVLNIISQTSNSLAMIYYDQLAGYCRAAGFDFLDNITRPEVN